MSLLFAIIILFVATLVVVYLIHGVTSGDWRIFVSEKTRNEEVRRWREEFARGHEFGFVHADRISFNDRCDLTRAAVTGKKTSTRIVLDCDPTARDYDRHSVLFYPLGDSVPVAMSYNEQLRFSRNAGRAMHKDDDPEKFKDGYRAETGKKGWTDKEYALPSLMLFTLKITGHKIQHLQDITDEEIFKEGIKEYGDGKYGFFDNGKEFFANRVFSSPREAYAALIDITEGENTWATNPWVLVLEFETNDRNRKLAGSKA